MANDFFLKIDGIPGESTDEKHMDEIVVISFAWGETNAAGAGGQAGHGAGRVHPHDFSYVSNLGKASPLLIKTCATGKHIEKVVLTCRKPGETQIDYFVVTLSEVFVTSYQVGGSSDLPLDNVSLNFATIEVAYCAQDQKGKAGPPTKAGFNFKTMKPL